MNKNMYNIMFLETKVEWMFTGVKMIILNDNCIIKLTIKPPIDRFSIGKHWLSKNWTIIDLEEIKND